MHYNVVINSCYILVIIDGPFPPVLFLILLLCTGFNVSFQKQPVRKQILFMMIYSLNIYVLLLSVKGTTLKTLTKDKNT